MSWRRYATVVVCISLTHLISLCTWTMQVLTALSRTSLSSFDRTWTWSFASYNEFKPGCFGQSQLKRRTPRAQLRLAKATNQSDKSQADLSELCACTMSFSYESSLDAWSPAKSSDDTKIRILQLYSSPWYLRWLPGFLISRIPLRASLSWVPLEGNASLTTGNKSPGLAGLYPSYKALSYTWGDNTETRYIYINGKRLKITLSLAIALSHLKPKSESLKIWIDQICINQEDNKEKSEQVGIMGRIYRNTEEALVWLGPAADGSDALMDMFNKLGAFAGEFDLPGYYQGNYAELQDIEMEVNPQDPKTIEYHTFCDSIVPELTHALFASLMAFYKRPWFNRAWVVQEFSLPPRVTFVCGHKTIGAEILMVVWQMMTITMFPKIIRASSNDRTTITLLETISDMDPLTPYFLSRRRRKAGDKGLIPSEGLYKTLQRTYVEQSVQATQGCDMVYGLLGLVNDAKQLGISADYSEKNQQLQTALTYTRTARAIISSGKVDLLVFAQHQKKDITLPSWVPDWRSQLRQSFADNDGQEQVDFATLAISRHLDKNGMLPSWVPDWRSDLRRSFAWLRVEENGPLFHACADQPLELCHGNDDRVLTLKGYKVDEIEEVGGPWTGGSRVLDGTSARFPHEEYLNYLAQIRQMCLLSKAKGTDIYPNSDRRDEAIWRIPVGDIDQDDNYFPIRASQSCKLKYDHCVAELELIVQVHSMSSVEEYRTRAAEVMAMGQMEVAGTNVRGNTGALYRTRMQELKGKRPFLSHIGYVGMGPSYMRHGDIIVVLSGASLPFIVRPLGEDRFRFLGECYCDGVMDGEIVNRRARETIVLV
jgi:hypothetical protein